MDKQRQPDSGHSDQSTADAEAAPSHANALGALVARYGPAAARRIVQRRLAQRAASGEAGESPLAVQAAAARGVDGAGGPLPYRDTIQRAFGRHDVSHVQAHTDGGAAEGAQAMGAEAFASGDHVAFAAQPTLHTAAHEAAHVIQQRGGVQLKGGVGSAGDAHEQQADAVADRVVAGESAEPLLDQSAPAGQASGGAGAGTAPVQRRLLIGAQSTVLPASAIAKYHDDIKQSSSKKLREQKLDPEQLDWPRIYVGLTAMANSPLDVPFNMTSDAIAALVAAQYDADVVIAQHGRPAAPVAAPADPGKGVTDGKAEKIKDGKAEKGEEQTADPVAKGKGERGPGSKQEVRDSKAEVTSPKEAMVAGMNQRVKIGTEFTFSHDSLRGMRLAEKGAKPGGQELKAKDLLDLWKARVKGCTQSTLKGKSQAVAATRFTYQLSGREWHWTLDLDDGCVETQTAPSTAEELDAVQEIITRDIFGVAATLKLVPDPSAAGGGGHLSLDAATTFGADAELFLRVLLELQEGCTQWQKHFGDKDALNAPWISEMTYGKRGTDARKEFLGQIKELLKLAEAKKITVAEASLKIREFNTKLHNPEAEKLRDSRDPREQQSGTNVATFPNHYQAVNVEHMAEEGGTARLELRRIPAQTGYDKLQTDIEYIFALIASVRLKLEQERQERKEGGGKKG